MTTLHLKVMNPETLEHLMWFLKRFDPDELQIISPEQEFDYVREELHNEIEAIDENTSGLMDIEELDQELERIISRYEN